MYTSGRAVSSSCELMLKTALEELVLSFTLEWLKVNGSNPVQILWKRNDFLASTEIILLGCSIKKIKNIDLKWVIKTIEKIKTDDANNRKGAMLEVIIAAALHNPPNQIVSFPAINNPGYDLIINLPDKSKICLSIKNYGRSKHSQNIVDEAQVIEEIVKMYIRSEPSQIFIHKFNTYPIQSDWKFLKNYLLGIPNNRIENIWDHCCPR
ncbi:MAG: hypothetical protein NTX71_04820 [Candidatus Aureabacteria bacterium]|nr:hypothetical protein [Candidatus Auribacterota bacterium]